MKKTFLNILFGVLLSFFFASCAIHEPMSEMVMFQQKKSVSDSTYYSKYSHSIGSYTNEYNLENAVLNHVGHYTESDPEYGRDEKSYGGLPTIITNLIFLNELHQELGLSIAIAPLLYGSGADFTYNIFRKYYFTAGFGLAEAPQAQLILQRRLLDGNPIGLSIGAVWRNNNRYVDISDGSMTGYTEDFYTTSIGIRSVLILAPRTYYGKPKIFFYGSFSYNYDITLEAFYPKIGFSLGIY